MAASDSVAAAKRSYAWEPPIVRRLRHRRLFSFLLRRGFADTFRALIQETDEHFCVIHLRELVEEGQWDGAARYLSRFLPPQSDPWSFDAQVLYVFVNFLGNYAKIAAGDKDVIDKLNLSASHSERWRATLDWVRLRSVAANMVEEMACRTPEFSRALRLPGGRFVRPHNVLPLWPSFRRRRHMKTHSRPAPSAVASALLQKKFWQDFCINHKSDQYSVGLSPEANETVKTKLRRCFLSAKRFDVNHAELQRQFQLPLNRKEGASCTPTSHTNLGMLAGFRKGSEVSTLTNGGAPVAPIQAMGSIGRAESIGISSVTNAGDLIPPISLTNAPGSAGIISVTNANAPVPPICQAMNLTNHAKNPYAGTKQSPGGCHTENAREGPIPKKRLRMNPICIDELQYLDNKKRERQTGEFTLATSLESDANVGGAGLMSGDLA